MRITTVTTLLLENSHFCLQGQSISCEAISSGPSPCPPSQPRSFSQQMGVCHKNLKDKTQTVQVGAHLVHDDIVDGVLIIVLVVAHPHREALWVVSLKVLHAHNMSQAFQSQQQQHDPFHITFCGPQPKNRRGCLLGAETTLPQLSVAHNPRTGEGVC